MVGEHHASGIDAAAAVPRAIRSLPVEAAHLQSEKALLSLRGTGPLNKERRQYLKRMNGLICSHSCSSNIHPPAKAEIQDSHSRGR
jgi:hypothetical protein